MATATPAFLQSPQWAGTAYTTASSTATHITGGSSGSRVSSLIAVSDSTSAHVFKVGVSTGGSPYYLGAVSIPASAGSDGSTPSVDMFAPSLIPGLPLDGNGVPYVNLPSTSHTLTVTATATINTGKQVTFSSVYGSY